MELIESVLVGSTYKSNDEGGDLDENGYKIIAYSPIYHEHDGWSNYEIATGLTKDQAERVRDEISRSVGADDCQWFIDALKRGKIK